MTALRWLNGITLLMALSACVVSGVLQWTGRFARSAAQTAWNTGEMFASGFQKNPPRAADPSVDWDILLTGLTLALCWLSLWIPQRPLWLHFCAAAAAAMAIWIVYTFRETFFAPLYLAALAVWCGYYYLAAWR